VAVAVLLVEMEAAAHLHQVEVAVVVVQLLPAAHTRLVPLAHRDKVTQAATLLVLRLIIHLLEAVEQVL
jgi:hypothetical protein